MASKGQEKLAGKRRGKQSVAYERPVYINASASIGGKKEGEGPLAELIDMIGCNTWEEAESSLQKDAVYLAMGKAGLDAKEIQYLFAGDLLGQSIATSFGIMAYEIPLFGLYGACSTCGESFPRRRITQPGLHGNRRWICHQCDLCDIQPLCQRGKRIPQSIGIWQSETIVGHLDRNGQRGVCPWP